MSNASSGFEPAQVESLRRSLKGSVLLPGERGYDEARQTWDVKTFDQHPAIIVMPDSASDVQLAVRFARQHNLAVGVQGGGHGHPYPVNNALLVNFKNMTGIKIEPQAGTARIEPGVLSAGLVKEAQSHNLAPINGFATTVGVVGYMLGGGCGWLSRQYGSAAASVLSMEVVTAEGDLIKANESTNPDLFWGLRGGGGNFGIVTGLECKLYPVKEVFGGQVVYPIELGKQVLKAYLDWTQTVPEQLTSALRIMHFPKSPDVPATLQGKVAIIVMACYNGAASDGQALLKPMRSFGNALLDTYAMMPYTEVGKISNDPEEAPPVFMYNDSSGFAALSPTSQKSLLDMAGDVKSAISMVEIRHLGGALAREPEDAMAFNRRNVLYYLDIQATAPAPDQLEGGKQAVAKLMQDLKPDLNGETLINFQDAGNVSPELTRSAYSTESYERLRVLKATYDPQNLFRFNHNIQPL